MLRQKDYKGNKEKCKAANLISKSWTILSCLNWG